jgi:transketolase
MNMDSQVSYEGKTMKGPFAKAIVELGWQNDKIVALTADLGKYTDLYPFQEVFPQRYFQIGMAEQNLFGVAGGMARTGLVPYATTYGVFATRRANEQIAVDINYGRANVKIICGLPGLTTFAGPTHQAIEDLALMRAMPGMTVVDPGDAVELYQATRAIAEFDGPVYMRLQRGEVPVFFDENRYRFELGRAKVLNSDGGDLLIISLGLMTRHALEAVFALEREGIRAKLIHVSTLKPFDSELIVGEISKVPAVVTCENHSVIGGLGSSVAEAAALHGIPIILRQVGVPDVYATCGSTPYLFRKYGLDSAAIVGQAKELVQAREQANRRRKRSPRHNLPGQIFA